MSCLALLFVSGDPTSTTQHGQRCPLSVRASHPEEKDYFIKDMVSVSTTYVRLRQFQGHMDPMVHLIRPHDATVVRGLHGPCGGRTGHELQSTRYFFGSTKSPSSSLIFRAFLLCLRSCTGSARRRSLSVIISPNERGARRKSGHEANRHTSSRVKCVARGRDGGARSSGTSSSGSGATASTAGRRAAS